MGDKDSTGTLKKLDEDNENYIDGVDISLARMVLSHFFALSGGARNILSL